MPKFQIPSQKVEGFAAESAKEGDQVKILVKEALTSDDPWFYIYITHISNLFIAKVGIPINAVFRFLIVQHEKTADIYVNDFSEALDIQINRDVAAGEKIYKNDIADIKGVKFPGIEIKKSDVVIYCTKINWKFGLYFNFTKDLDIAEMTAQLGGLHKELEFQNYLAQVEAIITEAKAEDLQQNINESVFLITEGKTDSMHVKNAIQKLNPDLNCNVLELKDDQGDDVIIKMCENFSKTPHKDKYIFMFDRDNPKIIERLNRMTKEGEAFQRWGKNVYSFMIPVPSFRQNFTGISIEFYYSDEEIRTRDETGKRLHFTNELKKEVLPGNRIRRVEIEPEVSLELTKKIDGETAENIFDAAGIPTGLSKTAFAHNILSSKQNFENFNLDAFNAIFDIISQISKISDES